MSVARCIACLGAAALLSAALGCAPPVTEDDFTRGTEVVRVTEREPRTRPDDAIASALAYADAKAPSLGMAGAGEFEIASSVRGPGELRYVRLRQRHRGLPVWGGDVVIRVSAEEVIGLSGALAPVLDASAGRPRLDRDEAIARAKAAHPAGEGAPAYAREGAELVVFPGEDGSSRLAWDVELFAEAQLGRAPSRPHRLLDADSGEVLLAYDALSRVAEASGPGGNARVDRFWSEALKVTESGEGYRMATPRLETVDMGGKSSGKGSVVEGPRECVGDRAANDAHGFASATLEMLASWMGRDSIDGEGAPIRSRVHYGEDYANAFWDGETVSYGDGGDAFYALSGDPSVVAHEIHHGFTEHHADLVFEGQAGALNESFSDIAGVALSYYLDGRLGTEPSLRVGQDIVKAPGRALRDLCDPPRDGHSIDHADDYVAGMFIHAASGVPNKAFCLAARRLSGADGGGGEATREGVRRAARAFFEANAGFWTRTTDFEQACRGVKDAAELLGYEPSAIDALTRSWRDVGVECAGR